MLSEIAKFYSNQDKSGVFMLKGVGYCLFDCEVFGDTGTANKICNPRSFCFANIDFQAVIVWRSAGVVLVVKYKPLIIMAMVLKDIWTRLEDPTQGLVSNYLHKYQNDKHYSNEDKIQKIIANGIYDRHKYETILLTVVVINELYSTSIYKVYSIADHIYNNQDEIHRLIEAGDSKAIAGIATGHDIISSKNKKELNFYSFASKYCNYLNPERFPIYDSYIENMLCFYNKKEPFAKFKRGDLRDYDTFRNIILKFKEHFNLNEFQLRDIDKFLWLYGKDLFKL